jgi:predicted amidohydrolase YtcJ
LLLHVSGHAAVANSLALSLSDIDEFTPDPAGGHIRRRDGGREPDGFLTESAAWAVYGRVPAPSLEETVRLIADVQTYYASFGITTVQEGGATPSDIVSLQATANDGQLFLDWVAYARWVPSREPMPDIRAIGNYKGRLKLGGLKLILDGSPQAKTAWLSQPYLVPPEGEQADYRGFPAYPAETVNKAVAAAIAMNIPLLAHANGDAAGDMLIDAVELALANSRDGVSNAPRVTMVHAQTARDDQLRRMASLGMIASFFTSHTYFWGDWHRDSVLGSKRAERISPARSALDAGVVFTLHNDAPVTPPNVLSTLWSAVNRRTRSNAVLGPEQGIDIADALRAVTINAAFQNFEEGSKGSITPGKLADLVILSGNPLTADPGSLREIKVLETISHGATVYRAP